METLFTWRRWHSFLSLREAGRSTCSTSIYLRHRADFTPVPTLCSRLIICILYMDKTRLWKRDLPKVTWLMRSGARVTSRSSDPNVADLLQSPGTIVWEQGKLIGQERGCSVGERKSSHTWCWERTQKQAEEKGRDCCKDPARPQWKCPCPNPHPLSSSIPLSLVSLLPQTSSLTLQALLALILFASWKWDEGGDGGGDGDGDTSIASFWVGCASWRWILITVCWYW